jgi:hypothetical protein
MNDVPIPLLRDALQSRVPAAPSQECLDAETVAAWADDALGRDERQAAEAHAADCARCQTLLAAMAATMPQTAARSWWRLPAMRWLVPLTVATAALLVWVNVPTRTPEPRAAIAMREARPEPTQPPADALPNAQPSAAFLAQAPKPSAKVTPGKERDATLDSVQKSNAGQSRDRTRVAPAKALSEAASGAGAPAASPAAPSELTAPLASTAAAPAERSAVESAPAAAPSVALQRSAAKPPAAFNVAARMLDARPPAALIVSSSPNIVWRIAPNGAVEHSTNGGSSWEWQSTGVNVMLTAGASPAPSICWLVGPQGIVVLTTDARSWQRIAFPEAVDLTSVRAMGDKIATVSTADGRAFSTTDGGRTWK